MNDPDRLTPRIQRLDADKLDRLADAMQGMAFRAIATGEHRDADKLERCALCVRNMAKDKRRTGR